MADQDPFGNADGEFWGEVMHLGYPDQQLEVDITAWVNYTTTAALDDQQVPDPSLPVFVQTCQRGSSSVDHIESRGLPYLDGSFSSAESIAENKLSDVTTSQIAYVPIRPVSSAFSPLNHRDSRWTSPFSSIGVETDSLALQSLPAQSKTSQVKPRRGRRNKIPVPCGTNRYGRMGTTRCLQCRKWKQKASHPTPVLTLVSVHI